LLHIIGFLYYFTYIDDARSNTNQEFISLWISEIIVMPPALIISAGISSISVICVFLALQ